METNKKSKGEGLFITAIIVAIALFRGCQKEQEATRRVEQTAAWEREQAENKWLQKEGERRRNEYYNKLFEEKREKNGATIKKWCEEQERRRQIYEEERIRQRAREGKGWRE